MRDPRLLFPAKSLPIRALVAGVLTVVATIIIANRQIAARGVPPVPSMLA